MLAPFTLGFSLLPTVFVVMYGNASAIAMYGGSQFVAGDKEKKKAPLEPPKIDPPKDSSPNGGHVRQTRCLYSCAGGSHQTGRSLTLRRGGFGPW